MSFSDLEKKLLDTKDWRRAPRVVYEMAMLATMHIPSALGRNSTFGWYMLQHHREYGSYVAWTEKNWEKRPYSDSGPCSLTG